MTCEWGYTDCQNYEKKCDLCFTSGQHYAPPKQSKPKQMARRQQKADKRMGGQFEQKNHQRNEAIIDTGSKMTINSGAWLVKGDEQIRGLINVMEELKTKVVTQAPGKESFTIKKLWLEKLNREAKESNEEFWYLKFSFHEHDDDIYIVVEQDVIMSMIVTMVEDRRTARTAQAKIDVAENRMRLIEMDNLQLRAEINLLKSQLRLQELEESK